MKHEQCFQLGTITKKVGVDGRVNILLDTDSPKNYIETESVFLEIHGKLVPFFITQFRLQPSNNAHVKFEDLDEPGEAEDLIGTAVYLPLELLPTLDGNQFYYHEIIGFEILDTTSNRIAGKIRDVYENGPNDLFVLDYQGQEVLIPVSEDWITEVNRLEQRILMTLPEGLVDVNRKA